MVRKLNRKAAEAYSEDFSSKILDNFFSNSEVATGQDILELTPLQQINLLLIQRLYQRWQEETLRLRSPYFNYQHPQVQDSLKAFMNTLSRHIQVERQALEPLLQGAVLDSLRLLLNPVAFFDEFLRLNPSLESLQASLRYLRWQQSLTDALQEQVEKKEMGDPEYLLAMLEAGVRSGNLITDPTEEYIEAFEQVLPLPSGLVEEPVASPQPAPPKEEPADDFFSAISRMAPRNPRPGARTAAEPESQLRPAPAPEAREAKPQTSAPRYSEPEPVVNRATPVEQEPVATKRPQPTVVMPPVIDTPAPETPRAARPAEVKQPEEPKKQQEENRSLNTRLGINDKKPLYEKFEAREPRSASLSQKHRPASIRHYITLNQRFMFVKELFDGNAAAFNASLDALDACQNYGEAQQWTQEHLAHKPQWQDDSEVVQEFMAVLDHRFGS
ncbi:hypothetical protein D770_16915 [Flammeovirgaceae bacterium 311]|nr:hypothetical protein D770_16915 [Flammeovirgaceae bacterium 311]